MDVTRPEARFDFEGICSFSPRMLSLDAGGSWSDFRIVGF